MEIVRTRFGWRHIVNLIMLFGFGLLFNVSQVVARDFSATFYKVSDLNEDVIEIADTRWVVLSDTPTPKGSLRLVINLWEPEEIAKYGGVRSKAPRHLISFRVPDATLRLIGTYANYKEYRAYDIPVTVTEKVYQKGVILRSRTLVNNESDFSIKAFNDGHMEGLLWQSIPPGGADFPAYYIWSEFK